MGNPFLFGKIVTGEHFCNREEEKRILEENLKGGQSLVVISPRRMGKSSLLAVIANRFKSSGIVCGRIDYFALNSSRKIIEETVRICVELILNQESSLKRFLTSTADIFKRTRIAIEPTPDGGYSVKPELALPLEIRTSLTEAVIGLDKFLGGKKKKGILVMDEFQEISSIDKDGAESLEAEFRTVVQATNHLSFAFLGSRASLLTEMFTVRRRPFFQAAKIIELGPIDRNSLKKYINRRFKTAGISIRNIDIILDTVEGHPDYTQRFCSHLYDILVKEGVAPESIFLSETVIQQTLREMIEGCLPIFFAEWENYPIRQQQVLSLLAEKGPIKRVPALYLAEYDMAPTSFNTALKELLRKGAVRVDENRQHHVADPIFGRWISRKDRL